MKYWLGILCALLLLGCGGKLANQGGTSSPGGVGSDSLVGPAAAAHAATNGAYKSIGTNVSAERAANKALANAATNAPSIGGNVTAPGGTSIRGGTGTGKHNAVFWVYVALGVGFLAWLVLAIHHRLRKPWASSPARG